MSTGSARVRPGTETADLGKAEDAAHTSGATGVMALGVRNNTWTALAGSDGDYNPIEINSIGATKTSLYDESAGTPVQINAAGAMLVGGAGATLLGKNVDVASGGSDTGVAMLAVRDDALTTLTPADGDYTQLRVTSTGQLHVNDGAANTKLTTIQGDTSAISAAILTEDDTHFTGDAGIQMLAVRNDSLGALAGTDGDYAPLQVNASGAVYIAASSIVPGVAKTNLGKEEDAVAGASDTGVATLAVRTDAPSTITPANGDYTFLRTNLEGKLWTAASVAARASTDSFMTVVGGEAAVTTGPTIASDADTVPMMTDAQGRVVTTNASRGLTAVGQASISTTAETTIIAAGGAGIFHDLAMLTLSNSAAATCTVTVRDAEAGTARFLLQVPGENTVVLPMHGCPYPQTAAANAWTIAVDPATTTLYATAIAMVRE